MTSDLTDFGLAEMLRCTLGLRRAAAGSMLFTFDNASTFIPSSVSR